MVQVGLLVIGSVPVRCDGSNTEIRWVVPRVAFVGKLAYGDTYGDGDAAAEASAAQFHAGQGKLHATQAPGLACLEHDHACPQTQTLSC